MEKKFIEDKQGNKILPITHVDAVRDDSGNTISSIMGAFEDEVINLVRTPHENYVTVSATSGTTSATQVLPVSGQSTDTIYRVSNWDGSTNSFNVTKYSEYAWDETNYVFLCVKSQIDEVFDITVYNSNTKYTDLAAALGTGGDNIPQDLRRGGMSVKFVQTSDNNYVKFFCTADEFTTDVSQWQSMNVDDEPTAGSDNLVKSGGVYKYTKNIKLETLQSNESNLKIQDDNDNIIVEVTNDGVGITGNLTVNNNIVATEEDIESAVEGIDVRKQDVIEEIDFEEGNLGEEKSVILKDDDDNIIVEVNEEKVDINVPTSLKSAKFVDSNKNIVSSLSIGNTVIESEGSQKWTNDEGTEEYAKIDKNGVTAKGFFKQNGTPVGNMADTLVVDPNGGGDYTNIVDALNNAGDTTTRHVTIIINQGTYDMPPKVSDVAPYVEYNRNLTLRGVNRNKCVLQCNIGFYDYTIGTDCTTLRLSGNVVIENLTIISSNEEYDNKIGTPGYITERTNRKAAYCIHSDNTRREGDVIVVRNCTLIDYQMSAIGFGTRKNSVLRIEDCYAQSEQAASDSAANGYGVIYGHNGASQDVGGQRVEVLRSQIIHKTGNIAVQYLYTEILSPINLECSMCLIGNACKTQNIDQALNIGNFPEGTFELDELSFGNQCSAMNV